MLNQNIVSNASRSLMDDGESFWWVEYVVFKLISMYN